MTIREKILNKIELSPHEVYQIWYDDYDNYDDYDLFSYVDNSILDHMR